MTTTPTFKNPPVVEFVLGVQFSPLAKLSAGQFGLLWKELRGRVGDVPRMLHQFRISLSFSTGLSGASVRECPVPD